MPGQVLVDRRPQVVLELVGHPVEGEAVAEGEEAPHGGQASSTHTYGSTLLVRW